MVDFTEVKQLVKEIVESDYNNTKDLEEEQQRVISTKIFEMSLSFFTDIKIAKPTYTIDNNTYLRKYKVNEDEIEEPSVAIISFFTGNTEALHELISLQVSKKKKLYLTEHHLFYMSLFSNITDEYSDVFFVSKSGNFWVFTDEITEMTLYDYISAYFVEIPDEMRGQIERLFDVKKNKHNVIQDKLTKIALELSEISKRKNYDFLNGAITFMDFLGWKGLWQNRNKENHLERVSNLINEIREVVQSYTREVFPFSDEIQLSKLISISDTIAIFTPEAGACEKVKILELHARIAKYILEKCVENKYPIRGAIAFGRYNTKNNIMIGPGIDECASWHETCNWIGVHFTPSAELLIETDNTEKYAGIIEYPVPVKNGYPKVKYCVEWDVSKDTFGKLTEEVQALLPEISSKYMNTYHYLVRKEG